MQATSTVSEEPCDRCKNGSGPFVGCIVAATATVGNGACANCHYSSMGVECSYHHRNSKVPSKAAQNSSPCLAVSPDRSLKRTELRADADSNSSNPPTESSDSSPEPVQRAHARVSTHSLAAPSGQSSGSPELPQPTSPVPTNSSHHASQAPRTMLYRDRCSRSRPSKAFSRAYVEETSNADSPAEADNVHTTAPQPSALNAPRRTAQAASAAPVLPGALSAPVAPIAASTIATLVAALGSGARPYDRWSFAEKRRVSQTLRRLAEDIDKVADEEISHLLRDCVLGGASGKRSWGV
jgi:hypothetical protein